MTWPIPFLIESDNKHRFIDLRILKALIHSFEIAHASIVASPEMQVAALLTAAAPLEVCV